MDATFINSGNSKTFDPHRMMLNLTDKIDLRKSDYFTRETIKNSCKNNKFKTSGPT